MLFRATHRGTQENDILLGGFIAPRIADFTESELDALEQLLDLPDPDLADWLTGRRPIPPHVDTPMLRSIMEVSGEGAEKQRTCPLPLREGDRERGRRNRP